MNTMKTFTLAGLAALSLGIGSALAQSQSDSVPIDGVGNMPTWSHQAPTPSVQAGSSDVYWGRSSGAPASRGDYSTLANSG